MKSLRGHVLAALVLAAVLLLGLMLGAQAEIVDSGTCGADGDNLTWTVDEDFVLTVSGTGAMADYDGEDGECPPWGSKYHEDIKTVIIENGVTTIGKYAFMEFSSLTNVVIPNSVISIGDSAFNACGLTAVTIPTGVTSIGA